MLEHFWVYWVYRGEVKRGYYANGKFAVENLGPATGHWLLFSNAR